LTLNMVTGPKYKKAPDAPKRFKSAFIIFSAEKHKEIKENFAKKGRSEKVHFDMHFGILQRSHQLKPNSNNHFSLF
jgi:HMG (high mobility group) box